MRAWDKCDVTESDKLNDFFMNTHYYYLQVLQIICKGLAAHCRSGLARGRRTMSQQLANGWSSHIDAGSGNTYYSRGEVTTWELPADAA